MMKIRFAIILLGSAVYTHTLSAQVTSVATDENGNETIALTLAAAKTSHHWQPVRFATNRFESKYENAVDHIKAAKDAQKAIDEKLRDDPTLDEIEKKAELAFWASSVTDAEIESAKKWLELHAPVLEIVAKIEKCRFADWDIDLKNQLIDPNLETSDAIAYTRQVARLLLLQAKMAILECRYQDAARSIRIANKLSSDVAQAQTLVGSLISIAIKGIIFKFVEQWISTPGTPAILAELRQISVNDHQVDASLRHELEMINAGIGLELLDDPLNQQRTAKQWNEIFQKDFQRFGQLSGEVDQRLNLTETLGLLAFQMRYAAMARRQLTKSGIDEEAVEKMPTAQVLAVYQVRAMQELTAPAYDATFIEDPVKQLAAFERVERLFAERDTERTYKEIFPIAKLTMPAVVAVVYAKHRPVSRRDVLIHLELIRQYLTEHNRFPNTEEELAEFAKDKYIEFGSNVEIEFNDDHIVLAETSLVGATRALHRYIISCKQ